MSEKMLSELFSRHGHLRYTGHREEPVTALEHALQCAEMAERANSPPSLIVAALVHDIGHFVERERPLSTDADDHHERLGAYWLAQWLPEAVTEPVRLHVDAKRYICAIEPGYYDLLTPASRYSLEQQGGVLKGNQIAGFESLVYSNEAIQLRRWDDNAKRSGHRTPDLSHYLAIAGKL